MTALLAPIGGGGFIARHNLRLGRGDRRGATRLAILVLCSFLLHWAIWARHVAGVSELPLFLLSATRAVFVAGAGWIAYIALEPLIRRRWPDSLIAWTRLLSGRLRDPLVGRALLAGALLGTLAALAQETDELVRCSVETPPPLPAYAWDDTLLGPRAVVAHLFNAPAVSTLIAVGLALLFFLFRLLLRKDSLAALAFVLFYASAWVLSGAWTSAPIGILLAAATLFVFLRFGLLAWVFQGLFHHFLVFSLTTDSSAWYAGTSAFLLVVLAALAVYGFVISLGGRPLFGEVRFDG